MTSGVVSCRTQSRCRSCKVFQCLESSFRNDSSRTWRTYNHGLIINGNCCCDSVMLGVYQDFCKQEVFCSCETFPQSVFLIVWTSIKSLTTWLQVPCFYKFPLLFTPEVADAPVPSSLHWLASPRSRCKRAPMRFIRRGVRNIDTLLCDGHFCQLSSPALKPGILSAYQGL